MATYCNQHWLLSHIRNSFISTDDTGMCETVMVSDDLPKNFLRRYQAATVVGSQQQQALHKPTTADNGKSNQRFIDPQLQEVDFVCYPGLDQSDDEDIDLSTQSFDIQMYPEVGSHRFRSNTAQKLEKMDIARRRAARTKCVNYDDDVIVPERVDLFIRKSVTTVVTTMQPSSESDKNDDDESESSSMIKSKLSLQLANSPKQSQNKFMEYARFDGTSQTGIQTKRINVFLNMLPEKERNYPIKICVVASAKISEVIGLVCYKATIQFPDIPLKSIRHYALYMTEDNDDMEDFPPLDNREPCSKFGFSHLTLAERRPLASVTRIDYHNNLSSKSMTSEEERARLTSDAVRTLHGNDFNGNDDSNNSTAAATVSLISYEERMLSHNDMLEAPIYRTYRLNIIDKRFFKTEVTLGISGERIEIDQHRNAKFWTKQKAVTYPIDFIAFCEIVERRNLKAILRIWLKSSSSLAASAATAGSVTTADAKASAYGSTSGGSIPIQHSPTSPTHYANASTSFGLFSIANLSANSHGHHGQIRFKHYDFEADIITAEHIEKKLNCILDVRSSEVRREFQQMRERKLEKSHTKKGPKKF